MSVLDQARAFIRERAKLNLSRREQQSPLFGDGARDKAHEFKTQILNERAAVAEKVKAGELTQRALDVIDQVLGELCSLIGRMEGAIPQSLLNSCPDDRLKDAFAEILQRRGDLSRELTSLRQQEQTDVELLADAARRVESRREAVRQYPTNAECVDELSAAEGNLRGRKRSLETVRARLAKLAAEFEQIETELTDHKRKCERPSLSRVPSFVFFDWEFVAMDSVLIERRRCAAIAAAAVKCGRPLTGQEFIEAGMSAADAIARLDSLGPSPILAKPAEPPVPANYPLSGPVPAA